MDRDTANCPHQAAGTVAHHNSTDSARAPSSPVRTETAHVFIVFMCWLFVAERGVETLQFESGKGGALLP